MLSPWKGGHKVKLLSNHHNHIYKAWIHIHDYDFKEKHLNHEHQPKGREKDKTQMLSLHVCTHKYKHSFNKEEHHSTNFEHNDDNNTMQDDNITNNNNDPTTATKLQQPQFQHHNSNIYTDRWEDHLNNLLSYKQVHIHCHVLFAYQNMCWPSDIRWNSNVIITNSIKKENYHPCMMPNAYKHCRTLALYGICKKCHETKSMPN